MKIKTEGRFEAAHLLDEYRGKCQRLHGHNWKVEVEIEDNRVLVDSCAWGILWDFGNLKQILDEFDHYTLAKDCENNREILSSLPKDWIVWLPCNPTAEDLAIIIKKKIYLSIPDFVDCTVRLWENDKCYAEVK